MSDTPGPLTRTRCQVYSRVVGFLTPISQWNKGKREEFKDRKTFDKQGGGSVDSHPLCR